MKPARFAFNVMLITPGLVSAAGAVLDQEVGQVLFSTSVVGDLVEG